MAVSIAAVLLIPFSICSNEILLRYPQNYYIQWLNDSLVHSKHLEIIWLGTYQANNFICTFRSLELCFPPKQPVPVHLASICILFHRVARICRFSQRVDDQSLRVAGPVCPSHPTHLLLCSHSLHSASWRVDALTIAFQWDFSFVKLFFRWDNVLFNLDIWYYQLPFIYSCVSLFGVALLLSKFTYLHICLIYLNCIL